MLACTAAPSATTSSGFRVRVRLALKHFLPPAREPRNARRSADQHDFIDLFRRKVRIFQRLLAGADGAVDDRLNQLLELFARVISRW
jgi:hypothetical protein